MSSPAPGILLGLSGKHKGRRYQLFHETSFGRGQDNEVPLDEASLSRRHARILYTDDKFHLMDLGSTNGCQVNGKHVSAVAVLLQHGDIVKLGFAEFRFERH